MNSVEGSLLELRRLIAKAREGGTTSDDDNTNKNDDDDANRQSKHDRAHSLKELKQRFVGLEEKLLRQHHLREQAHKLHERARRRRQQGERSNSKKGLTRECESACNDTVELGKSVVGHELSSLSSGPLCDATHLRKEGSTLEDPRHFITKDTLKGGNLSHERDVSLYVADSDAYLLVNITDGSTRLEGESGHQHLDSENTAFFCGNSAIPSYSFTQAYAEDDRQRLLFIIDQLSHILREERRQKEALLQHVVPVMLRRMEALERNVSLQRREIATLRRKVALESEFTRTVKPTNNNNNKNNHTNDVEEGRVVTLLEQCEKQIHQILQQNTRKK